MGKCSVCCSLSAERSEICSGEENHAEAVSKVSLSCGTLQAFSFGNKWFGGKAKSTRL